MRPHLTLDRHPDTKYNISTDEAKVASFDLPPLLEPGADLADWPARRLELIALFEDHVYGRVPDLDLISTEETVEEGEALGGLAVRRQVRIRLEVGANRVAAEIEVLLYLPTSQEAPAPVFLVPNFEGNHTVSLDPEVFESMGARRDKGDGMAERGSRAHRFPVRSIIAKGCGLVTFFAADVDSDADDGFANGIQRAGYVGEMDRPEADEWGTIGAWSWACIRVLDLLVKEPGVDGERVIVGGHSRLGKTALWAAAQDERFAAAFSNDSGCTGAALSRRRFGENVAVITSLFPHWFCLNYRCYANNESSLPVDQHQLIALVAPRPVHVASASEDQWADPRGEFMAVRAASEAWEHLGFDGLQLDEFPKPGTASIGRVGYHLREGEHELLAFDWDQYLTLVDQL